MFHKISIIIIFLMSLICLLISMRLFWNLGIFVDENNLTPAAVYGGEFWSLMNWSNMGIVAVICILSGIGILLDRHKNSKK